MKQLLRLLLGIIPCLFFACEYSPSGSHYEDISPQPKEVDAYLFLSDNEDTILVRGEPRMRYHAHTPGSNFYGFVLKLNGQVIHSGAEDFGYFYFRSFMYPDGYHTLQLSGFVASGTGSMADKYGVEAVEVLRTWVIHIDNSLPSKIAITSVAPKEGYLELEWEHYGKGRGFRSYNIIKNGMLAATITDPDVTSWRDDLYIGGPVTYYIDAHADNTTATGPEYSYEYPIPRILSSTLDEEKGITTTFSSTPFYGSFESYDVIVYIGTTQYTHKATSHTDTVFTIPNPGFGMEIPATLYTRGRNKKGHITTTSFEGKLATLPGGAWGPHRVYDMQMRANTNLFYTHGDNGIIVIDANTLQVKQEHHTPSHSTIYNTSTYTVSEDGQHLYMIANGALQKLHPSTLQTISSHKLQDLLPHSKYTYYRLSCSNNNRLAIEALNVSTQKDTVYLFDMARQKVLTKYRMTGEPNAMLSPDGKALKFDSKLYLEQANGGWAQHGVSWDGYNGITFHPTQPLFVVKKGLTLSFYSTATGTLQKTMQTESELWNIKIDGGSGYLYSRLTSGQHLSIYDIESGKLIRKIKLSTFVNDFMLYKNRIFSDHLYAEL